MAPVKHNLVALGSAAVISVYAAGYARTRAAAAQFADESRERRPARPTTTDAVLPTVASPASPAERPPSPAVVSNPHKDSASHPRAEAKSVAKAKVAEPADTVSRRGAPKSEVANPPTPPAVATTTVAGPPPKDSVAKSTSVQTADSASQTDKSQAALKDGMFTGWGTSRHGDIQATVMIKEGKIVGAVISECLTQYSCSWISALPQQVLDRQSAEVDFISGATQSTNAFYYAVLNALKKAK